VVAARPARHESGSGLIAQCGTEVGTMLGRSSSASNMYPHLRIFDDVFNLTPDEHSIGLVKNFTMSAEPRTLDLTQGIRNSLVYSVTVEFPVKANFDVFEYTASNIAYSLSMEGFADRLDTKNIGMTVTASITGGPTATSVDIAVTSDISAAFKIGDWIIIQDLFAGRDLVHVAKLTSDGVYTAAAAGPPATPPPSAATPPASTRRRERPVFIEIPLVPPLRSWGDFSKPQPHHGPLAAI
jgi:hypothetical protein